MSSEVEDIINYFEEQIKEQYKNYPEISNAIVNSIKTTNFSFISGNNLFDRVYGRILEIVVATLYWDYLDAVNMKGADFVVIKSPLETIDQIGLSVDLDNEDTYNSRALPVVENELLEFKSAINGIFKIKFIKKDGEIKDYQYNNLLVAYTKNNNDFYFPYLFYIKKEKIKNEIQNNVRIGDYKILENEYVEGEEKCITSLDVASIR